MSEYRFHRLAEQDVAEIARWIARDSPDASARFLDGVFEECQFIADWPEASRKDGFTRHGLAGVLVRPMSPPVVCYRVFFRVEPVVWPS